VSRTGLGRHRRIEADPGDPLDGLVNLFDVGMILAIAFLIAGLGLTLNVKGGKLEARRGAPSAAAGAKGNRPAGASRERVIPNPAAGPHARGHGTPVGQVYRLPDGRFVYVTRPTGR
jgi:hypothetical protein